METNLAISCMRIFAAQLDEFKDEEYVKKLDAIQSETIIDSLFLMAFVWSVGGCCNDEGRQRFDQFTSEEESHIPKGTPFSSIIVILLLSYVVLWYVVVLLCTRELCSGAKPEGYGIYMQEKAGPRVMLTAPMIPDDDGHTVFDYVFCKETNGWKLWTTTIRWAATTVPLTSTPLPITST
eukprot:5406014-Pyramimonas_sp.AAC.1